MTMHESLLWATGLRGASRTSALADAALGGARWQDAFVTFVRRENGQDVVEYGILIATIAVVVLLGVTTFGQEITPWFSRLAGHITTVGT
jgi:Flp pilus assembly pilin Flp